jgi:hypothetical protein
MDQAVRDEADRRFVEALKESDARDPRDFYRDALRELRKVNPGGYDQAVNHFQEVLIPGIAKGDSEPLRAWRDYGRLIAELTAPGRDAPMDRLVLHIPNNKSGKALLVALPPEPSPAQRATYDLLVCGKHQLSGAT